jgi:hypothetical protein
MSMIHHDRQPKDLRPGPGMPGPLRRTTRGPTTGNVWSPPAVGGPVRTSPPLAVRMCGGVGAWLSPRRSRWAQTLPLQEQQPHCTKATRPSTTTPGGGGSHSQYAVVWSSIVCCLIHVVALVAAAHARRSGRRTRSPLHNVRHVLSTRCVAPGGSDRPQRDTERRFYGNLSYGPAFRKSIKL